MMIMIIVGFLKIFTFDINNYYNIIELFTLDLIIYYKFIDYGLVTVQDRKWDPGEWLLLPWKRFNRSS